MDVRLCLFSLLVIYVFRMTSIHSFLRNFSFSFSYLFIQNEHYYLDWSNFCQTAGSKYRNLNCWRGKLLHSMVRFLRWLIISWCVWYYFMSSIVSIYSIKRSKTVVMTGIHINSKTRFRQLIIMKEFVWINQHFSKIWLLGEKVKKLWQRLLFDTLFDFISNSSNVRMYWSL